MRINNNTALETNYSLLTYLNNMAVPCFDDVSIQHQTGEANYDGNRSELCNDRQNMQLLHSLHLLEL